MTENRKKDLCDSVVLITGASHGIGRTAAILFGGERAKLVLCARGEPELAKAARETGGTPVPCDVSSEEDVDKLFRKIHDDHGRLDVVVNNAGIFRSTPLLETEPEMFDDVLAVNLRGVFLVSREAFRLMSGTGGGRVINVCSQAGKDAFEGSSAYCASKFGLVGLSKVMAIEGEKCGIHVSVIYPGAVDTRMWDGLTEDRSGFLTSREVAEKILLLAKQKPPSGMAEIDV